MKSPLWILNSAVALLVIICVGYILFSLKNITEVPTVISIKPSGRPEMPIQDQPKPQDIKLIYQEKDLFGTYRPTVTEKPLVATATVPKPPAPKPIMPPQKPVVQFLDPLPVTISGIVTSTNETKSHVIFINNTTRQSKSYKVGDKLFDAYIVRILPKKVILVRSNGQQESIFMSPADAQAEIKTLQDTSWDSVVERQSQDTFSINTQAFITRVQSLAQLIDMLDATTAFRKGVSVGCRIGTMPHNSIGYALGLQPGDVITNINGIAPTSTTNRVKIYNTMSTLAPNSIVTVQLVRQGQNIIYNYILKVTEQPKPVVQEITKQEDELSKKKAQEAQAVRVVAFDDRQQQETKMRLMQEKYRLTPTIHDLKKQDKHAMRHYGSRSSLLKGLPHKG